MTIRRHPWLKTIVFDTDGGHQLPNTVKWYHLGILCTYSKRPVGALAIAVLLRFDANLHALLGPGAILGFFIPELGYFNHPRAQYQE